MRPLLVGIDNPHSDDPAKALGLDPVGGSGYRLWLMVKEAANKRGLDFGSEEYLATFQRVNLFNGRDAFDRHEVLSKFNNRRVVLLGTRIPRLLGIRYRGFDLVTRAGSSFLYNIIPHPSGLCREYNDPSMRLRVGNLLFNLYQDFDSGE